MQGLVNEAGCYPKPSLARMQSLVYEPPFLTLPLFLSQPLRHASELMAPSLEGLCMIPRL